MTIDAQCKEVKARLDAAEKARGLSEQNSKRADDLYLSAGLQLREIRAAVGDNRGKRGVVTWVQVCGKIGVSESRANELIAIAGGGPEELKKQRDQNAKSKRSARARRNAEKEPPGRPGGSSGKPKPEADAPDCGNACDYDWKNPPPNDFGDPSKMYKAQAENYRKEAKHLADAYPLLAPGISPKTVTKSEIRAADEVVKAWLVVVAKLKEIATKAG